MRNWNFSCPARFNEYSRFPPINLGAVFGSPRVVSKALSLLICELKSCGGWDQFVFSRLVYTDYQRLLPKVTVDLQETGRIAHLCSNMWIGVSLNGVVNGLNHAYDIVHQYDRYSDLEAHFKKMYPFLEVR